MALDTEKLTFELEVDSSGAIKGLNQVEKATEDVGKASKKSSKDQDKFAKSLDDSAISATGLNQSLELLIKAYEGLKRVVGPVVTSFAKFEKDLVGVGKTTNLTSKELAVFGDRMIAISKTMPVAASELLNIAEAAGQLGIGGAANLEKFAVTISKIGFATNLTADEAGTAFARILKLTGEPIQNVENLASAVVSLGNTFETTEKDIVAVASGLSRSTSQFAVTSKEVVALSTALSSIGQAPDLAASVIGRTFRTINDAINKSGEEFQKLQAIVGMTGDELRKTFREAPTDVLVKFLEAVQKSGLNAADVLGQIGLAGDEINSVLPALATTLEDLKKALDQSNKAFKEATALNEEAKKAFETTAGALQLLANQAESLAIAIGMKINPFILKLIENIRGLLQTFESFKFDVEKLRSGILVLTGAIIFFGRSALLASAKAAALVAVLVGIDIAVNNLTPTLLHLEKGFLNIVNSFRDFKIEALEAQMAFEKFMRKVGKNLFSSISIGKGPTNQFKVLNKEVNKTQESLGETAKRIKEIDEELEGTKFNLGNLGEVLEFVSEFKKITEEMVKQGKLDEEKKKVLDKHIKQQVQNRKELEKVVSLTKREKELLQGLEDTNIQITSELQEREQLELSFAESINNQHIGLLKLTNEYDEMLDKMRGAKRESAEQQVNEILVGKAININKNLMDEIFRINQDGQGILSDISQEYGLHSDLIKTTSERLEEQKEQYKDIAKFIREIVNTGLIGEGIDALPISEEQKKILKKTLELIEEMIKLFKKAAEINQSFGVDWAENIRDGVNIAINGINKLAMAMSTTIFGLSKDDAKPIFKLFDEKQEKDLASLLDRTQIGMKRAGELFAQSIEKPTKALGNLFRLGGEGLKGAFDIVGEIDSILTGGNIGKGLKSAFGSVFGGLGDTLSKSLHGFLNNFSPVSDQMASKIRGAFGVLNDKSGQVFKGLGDQLGKINFGKAFEGIDFGSIFKGAFDGVATFMDTFSSAIATGANIWISLVQAISNFSKEIVDSIMKLDESLIEGARQIVRLFDNLPEIITKINDALLETLPRIINAIMSEAWVEAANAAVLKLADAIPGLITMIISQIPKMFKAIVSAFPDLITKVFQAIGSLFADIFDALVPVIETIAEMFPVILERWIEGVVGAAVRIVTAFIDTFINKGGAVRIAVAIVKALLNIIPSIAKALIRSLANGLKTLFSGFKWPLPDLVPLQKEIKKGLDELGKGAGKVAEDVFKLIDIPEERDALVDPLKQAKIAQKQAERIVNGLTKMWRRFWLWLEKTWRKMWKVGAQIWEETFAKPTRLLFMWFQKGMLIVTNLIAKLFETGAAMVEFVKGLLQGIWTLVSDITESIKQAFLKVMENIRLVLKPIFDAFKAAAKSIEDGFKKAIETLEGLGEDLVKFFEDLPGKVEEAFKQVFDFFDVDLSIDVKSAFQPVFDFFNNIPNLFTQAGTNLANGAKSIFEGLAGVFGSLDMNALGNKLGDAVGAGINKTIKEPINKLIDVINGMVLPAANYNISAGRLGSWSGQLFPAIDLIPGNIPRLAEGGPIGGKFDGTDNQLIAAMPGEFVLNRGAVSSIGQDNVAAMNRTGQMPKGGNTTNNSVNIEPGAIVVSQQAGEDSEQLANRIIEMLKERSAAGQTVIFESGVRAS